MKKLIIILLLTTASFAQSSLLLLYGEEGYKNAETKIYLASLTTPISKTYAATLDSFITMVKDSLAITSLSSKFDVMYDLGGETAEQSLKNLVKRQHDATAVNSPTFTQWQGFQGDGTSSYLNTNYNPNVNRTVMSQNSASLGFYSRTNDNASVYDIGAFDGTKGLMATIYSSIAYTALNSSLANTINTTSLGCLITSRVASDQVIFYKNGTILGSPVTSASLGYVNYNIYIGGRNSSGSFTLASTRQYSFAFIGAGLSATEVLKFTNCVEWLMDRKGTGVIP